MTNRTRPESDVRELAQRAADGIEVTLLWSAARGRVWVEVYACDQANLFEVLVAPDQALNAFYHPYAYAALTRRYGGSIPFASVA